MSLMRGKLFAGALFVGALLGGANEAPAVIVDQVSGGGYLRLGGGKSNWERKRAKLLSSNKKDVEEAVQIIESIAKELPSAPVTELRAELKQNDIVYDEEYKKLLKLLIKEEIEAKAEYNDEESIIMLIGY